MSQVILWPGLPPKPAPSSQPTSSPSPTTPPAKTSTIVWLSPIVSVVFAGLVVGGVWLAEGRWPFDGPSSSPDGAALGRSFAPLLASALADGFEKGADLLAQGKSVKEADDALKQTFLDSRQKAFKDKAAPAFAAIVPFDTEPKDAAAREAYTALFRDFAKGLRRAR